MIPEPRIVADLIEAFRRSKTMFTPMELGASGAMQPTPLAAWCWEGFRTI